MSDPQKLSGVLLNGISVKECQIFAESGHYRLYVSPFTDSEKSGFKAIALGWAGCVSDGDIWECEETEVEVLFSAIAYFDGVRHLEFDRESNSPGYIYYPEMEHLVEMFKALREYEKQNCWDVEK